MPSRTLPYSILALLGVTAALLAQHRAPAAHAADHAPAAVPHHPAAATPPPTTPPPPAAPRPLTEVEKARFAKGEELYSVCLGCHQPDGQGSPGMAPPLTASRRVNGPDEALIKILLQGLQGPYSHGKATFEGVMPSPPLNDDEEVAAVATYIRRSFGNAAGPIGPEEVAAVRARTKDRGAPWTAAELDGK